MKELKENFEFWRNDNPESIHPFMAACRDYEATDTEKYVVACLTEDQARQMYNFLKKHFD